MARDDILRALEALVAAGKARAVAVAGDAAAAAAALGRYPVVQLPLPPPGADPGALAAARRAGQGAIVHSVFADASREALARRVAGDAALAARAAAAGQDPAAGSPGCSWSAPSR